MPLVVVVVIVSSWCWLFVLHLGLMMTQFVILLSATCIFNCLMSHSCRRSSAIIIGGYSILVTSSTMMFIVIMIGLFCSSSVVGTFLCLLAADDGGGFFFPPPCRWRVVECLEGGGACCLSSISILSLHRLANWLSARTTQAQPFHCWRFYSLFVIRYSLRTE